MAGDRLLGKERAEETVAGKGGEVALVQRPGDGAEIVVHIAAEVGRIVRIDRRPQSQPQHPRDGMILDRRHHPKLEVGERADRQGHLLAGQSRDQGRIFQGAIAVVQPVDPQHIQRLGDIGRRAFLAGVGDTLQPAIGGGGEDAGELGRRMAQFR